VGASVAAAADLCAVANNTPVPADVSTFLSFENVTCSEHQVADCDPQNIWDALRRRTAYSAITDEGTLP